MYLPMYLAALRGLVTLRLGSASWKRFPNHERLPLAVQVAVDLPLNADFTGKLVRESHPPHHFGARANLNRRC